VTIIIVVFVILNLPMPAGLIQKDYIAIWKTLAAVL